MAADGCLYIADSANYSIRRMTPDGAVISTFAGATAGILAIINSPAHLALDPRGGALYVSDEDDNCIYVIRCPSIAPPHTPDDGEGLRGIPLARCPQV